MIVDFPENCLASRNWQQPGARLQKQRSVFTGHGSELDFGAAARWVCECSPVPMTDDAQRDEFAAFETQAQLPGAMFRMPAVIRGQQGAGFNLLDGRGWLPPGGYVVPELFQDGAPVPAGFRIGAGLGPFVQNPVQYLPVTVGERLWVAAWVKRNSATANFLDARLYFRNSAGAVIGNIGVSCVGGTADIWRRVVASGFAPAGAVECRFQLDCGLTAGEALVGGMTAARLPERAFVNGASNAGRELSVTGLAPSMRNLRAGKLITVVLPNGDEQLLKTASHMDADASGNATVTLATPLRRTPDAGAAVELDEPWGLMRATNEPGWSEEPGPIYSHTLTCEEAF